MKRLFGYAQKFGEKGYAWHKLPPGHMEQE
jgi:hypothetical protein